MKMSKKLQYYLRGLGAGILVTVLILGITGSKDKETLSDAEIKARAAELGMVESGSRVLTDLQPASAAVDEPASADGNTAGETGTADEQEAVGETKTSEDQKASEETGAENQKSGEEGTTPSSQGSASGDCDSGTVSFYIESGTNSYSISKDLEAAGLIEDARAFDTYLCNIGYSKSLRAGTYEIPIGIEEEEIVKIITGKN